MTQKEMRAYYNKTMKEEGYDKSFLKKKKTFAYLKGGFIAIVSQSKINENIFLPYSTIPLIEFEKFMKKDTSKDVFKEINLYTERSLLILLKGNKELYLKRLLTPSYKKKSCKLVYVSEKYIPEGKSFIRKLTDEDRQSLIKAAQRSYRNKKRRIEQYLSKNGTSKIKINFTK